MTRRMLRCIIWVTIHSGVIKHERDYDCEGDKMNLQHLRYALFLPGLCLACLSSGAGQPASSTPANSPASFKLTSTAFSEGKAIPAKYAMHGENVAPPLAWTGAPEGTKSYALIVEDPDAPRGTWVHWVLFNLPGKLTGLAEGIPGTIPAANPAYGASQGKNSGKNTQYDGPAPPSGTHRYFFRLYALDEAKLSGVNAGAGVDEVRKAMKGHELGHATLMGTYSAK